MAEPSQSPNPPGDSTKPGVPATNQSVPGTSGPTAEAFSQDPNLTLPPVDPSLSVADTSLPPIDPALPSIDSTLPPIDQSLPAIDTSLPSLDTAFPSTETNRPVGAEADLFKPNNTGPGTTTVAAQDSNNPNNDAANQAGSHAPVAPAQNPSSNGVYQQQQQQPPPQQQSQGQQFHQPNQGMLHNAQPGAQSINTGPMQSGGHPAQGQHVPQAPIGSPLPNNMPSMAPMGQYMGGYSTNMPQMGVNANSPMRYQMQGDPNRMLSGQRHKKEVKRRTKTGCLTCRKRRIKVSVFVDFVDFVVEDGLGGQKENKLRLASAPTKTPPYSLGLSVSLPPLPTIFSPPLSAIFTSVSR